MSLALTSKCEILRDRAALFAKARKFFADRGVLEVDVPILSRNASIDLHIDLIQARCLGSRYFLHSSPEYGMKRLLSDSLTDIYQLSHVFRDGEKGDRHNPEFTMVEWYRKGFTLQEMIAETVAFCALFVETASSYVTLGYKEAFLKYANCYPNSAEERDQLFGFEIEPHLGVDQPTVLIDFPKEQAALAKIGKNGMAERFEVYIKGFELGNGYHELLDAEEQRNRQERANKERKNHGKEEYPIDVHLIEALKTAKADCCGVAVGFDRLMMLRHGVQKIDAILPIDWEYV